jgi:glycosyltransferase involved in cell wall biosynthesis
MLDGGKAGVLVPPRRPDLLADAIIRVLSDKAVLAEMRARSRLNLDHFTVERACKECISIYDNALR